MEIAGMIVRFNTSISTSDIAREPFRIFFPVALLTGLIAVSLWPLHFAGIVPFYPGRPHAQLMIHGFFGGFIFGVLGTGLPRMLSTTPFRLYEILAWLACYSAMVLLNLGGQVTNANLAMLAMVSAFLICAIPRITMRADVPPPGFVLVSLALACLIAGTCIAIAQAYAEELPIFWINLERLLSFQGFVLLPILGVGAFLLPRFFELPNQHSFPESRTPPPGWARKAAWAFLAGVGVLISFVLEAAGWERLGHLARVLVSGSYLFTQLPIFRSPIHTNTMRLCLAAAVAMMLLGFLAVAIYPVNKVAVLHLTLVGGFAVLTFGVATRVVFGHSGNHPLLEKPNRWLLAAVGLMVLGMATRISGDLFPALRVSHYSYGAIAWILGSMIWAAYVLPKVLIRDSDDS